MVGTSATVAFLARKPSMALRRAGTVRATTGLRNIGINLLGMAVNGFAARGKNPTLSSPPLRRQARELSLAAGGGTSAERSAEIVGSITDRVMRVGIHD